MWIDVAPFCHHHTHPFDQSIHTHPPARSRRCRTWTRFSATTRASAPTARTWSWGGGRRSGCWCTGSGTFCKGPWRRRAAGGGGAGGGWGWRGRGRGKGTTRGSGWRPRSRSRRRCSGTPRGPSSPSRRSDRATRGALWGGLVWWCVVGVFFFLVLWCWVGEKNHAPGSHANKQPIHLPKTPTKQTHPIKQGLSRPGGFLHPRPAHAPGRAARRGRHHHHAHGPAGPHPALGLLQDGGADGAAPPPDVAGG